MKYILILLVSLILLSFNVSTTWKLDTVHSNLVFGITHLNISTIKGSFKIKDATIVTSSEDFIDAVVNLELDVNSIDTDNDKRDAHLRTADFFDTEKFPAAIFKSTSCKKSGNNYSLSGDLEMHGIKKPVTLEMQDKSGISAINNKPIHGVKVTGTIKRSDFAIATTTPLEILSDEVMIEANLEFSKE